MAYYVHTSAPRGGFLKTKRRVRMSLLWYDIQSYYAAIHQLLTRYARGAEARELADPTSNNHVYNTGCAYFGCYIPVSRSA